jgi:hypothetical protein
VDRPPDLEKLREEIAFLTRAHPELVPRRTAATLPEIEDTDYSLGPEFD